MSQPDVKPLSAGELDDFERALLDSVGDDTPPDEGRKKTLAALGLSASSAASPAPRPASFGKQLWSDLSKGKIVAIGIVALGTGLAVSKFSGREAPVVTAPSPPREAPAPMPLEQAPREQAPLGEEKSNPAAPTAETRPMTPEMLPRAPQASTVAPRPSAPRRAGEVAPASATPTSTSPSPSPSPSSLAREIAAIEAARSELSRGNSTTTLALLDAYDKEFPRGAFSVEVAALRIEALAREGRAAEVDRLAAAFLSAYPSGVYTRRVEEARARARTGKPGASAPRQGEQ